MTAKILYLNAPTATPPASQYSLPLTAESLAGGLSSALAPQGLLEAFQPLGDATTYGFSHATHERDYSTTNYGDDVDFKPLDIAKYIDCQFKDMDDPTAEDPYIKYSSAYTSETIETEHMPHERFAFAMRIANTFVTYYTVFVSMLMLYILALNSYDPIMFGATFRLLTLAVGVCSSVMYFVSFTILFKLWSASNNGQIYKGHNR